MTHLSEVRIEKLLLVHKVNKKKVREYMIKIRAGEPMEPVLVTYCVHTGKYEVFNGHHRVAAAYLMGKSSILAEIEPCYLFECPGYEPECTPYLNIRHIT
jgi:ParB-like chromosome segregation protein Spo0J